MISDSLLQALEGKVIIEVATGKSLPEALLFAEHGENMLCTKIVLNVRVEFGIFMF